MKEPSQIPSKSEAAPRRWHVIRKYAGSTSAQTLVLNLVKAHAAQGDPDSQRQRSYLPKI